MSTAYCSLADIREYLSLASQNTSDDATLTRFIQRASRSIDQFTRRKFYPHIQTRVYNLGAYDRIYLDDDLLELTTLTTKNGDTTIAAGVLFLGTGESWNYPPYDRIMLDRSAGCVLSFSGTPQKANAVLGVWCYHENYSEAWVDTGTSLATNYTASATVLNLAGAGSVGTGASDVNFEYPRFAVGDLLKVGNEYFEVLSGVSGTGNASPLVRPASNGTTAASHASGASIARFVPEPDIEWCAVRLTAYLYGQKDSPYRPRQASITIGTIDLQDSSFAADVKDKLDRFKRRKLKFFPGAS